MQSRCHHVRGRAGGACRAGGAARSVAGSVAAGLCSIVCSRVGVASAHRAAAQRDEGLPWCLGAASWLWTRRRPGLVSTKVSETRVTYGCVKKRCSVKRRQGLRGCYSLTRLLQRSRRRLVALRVGHTRKHMHRHACDPGSLNNNRTPPTTHRAQIQRATRLRGPLTSTPGRGNACRQSRA